jgi:coproporphyrinogen III oxidase-like Fe-S oxidoreductase
VMLGLRMREGLSLSSLGEPGVRAATVQAGRGRVAVVGDRVQLTRKGRLFADAVARELSA